jgi:nucleoside-diphosphate-sugar epimerase
MSKLEFTILGSSGFIGSNISKTLKNKNFDCYTPDVRKESLDGKNLGNVIYSLGVSDFRNKPLETIDAHICILNKILKNCNFDSLLYISSGRMYYNIDSTLEENSLIGNPNMKNDLYNLSKLQGELLCQSMNNPKIKIIRPSNVVGITAPANLFIPSLIKEAVTAGKIVLHSTLDSEKDYVYIDDLVELIPKIISSTKFQLYNIASGYNISSSKIINEIIRLTDCKLEIASNAKKFSSGQINIDRIKTEFNFVPINIIEKIENIIKFYQTLNKN